MTLSQISRKRENEALRAEHNADRAKKLLDDAELALKKAMNLAKSVESFFGTTLGVSVFGLMIPFPAVKLVSAAGVVVSTAALVAERQLVVKVQSSLKRATANRNKVAATAIRLRKIATQARYQAVQSKANESSAMKLIKAAPSTGIASLEETLLDIEAQADNTAEYANQIDTIEGQNTNNWLMYGLIGLGIVGVSYKMGQKK